jgi:hypothetical protein
MAIPTKLKGFTPILDSMTARYGLVGAAVFGVVWRHANMRNGVCSASQERMAALLGISRITINRWIATLCTDGYLEDTTPDTKNRAHVYRVTGKAGLKQTIEAFDAGVTESDTEKVGVSESDSGVTESYSSVTESYSSVTESYTSIQLGEELGEEGGEENQPSPSSNSIPPSAESDAYIQELTKRFIQDHTRAGYEVVEHLAQGAVLVWIADLNKAIRKGKDVIDYKYEWMAERYKRLLAGENAPSTSQPIAWEVAG